MKKIILSTVFLGLLISLQAQSKFEVTDLGKFKLHSFITGNPLGDINYLIEGKTGLVILEPVAFYKDIEEFKTYIEKLGKPIVKVIANYHIAGFSAFDASKFVRIEGMPEFSEGSVYKGMMSNFAKVFKGEMDLTPYTKTALVSKNAKEKWAGVSFQFSEGVASDFPAASIIIGKKIYYTHFTPEKAHPSHLQIHDRKALDAVLSELQKVEKSGCSVVIGGHGAATADIETVKFEIEYLNTIRKILETQNTKESFVVSVKKAYPDLTGNLEALANVLYK